MASKNANSAAQGLHSLAEEVSSCRACERLVQWRESVVEQRRAAFTGQTYWARPLPGFGDPAAQLLLVGLAPAAHGGHRTGRMFTGDRSGDFLYAALHRAGFASIPTSTALDDGLELRNAYVTAAVRCAPPDNRPTPAERATCAPYLARELELLDNVRVVVALGAFALESLWHLDSISKDGPRRLARPKFAHGQQCAIPERDGKARTLLCSYHPSQRNVFTGLLTASMLDQVLQRASELCAS